MSKRPPTDPDHGPKPSGPPPLRRPEPVRAAKSKRRATLKEVLKAMRNPTIHTLRRDLSHYLVYGLFAFVIIFALGAFMSFGEPPQQQSGYDESGDERWPLIAKVGRDTLERETFYERLRNYGMMSDEMLTYRYQQIGQLYDAWVDEQLIAREAKRRHVSIPAAELEAKIDEQVEQALESQRGELSERDFTYRLEQQGKSLTDLRAELRATLTENRAAITSGLLQEKVRENIEAEVALTEEEFAKKYNEVEGNVILIRAGQRKPPPLAEGTTETAEETARRAEQQAAYEKSLAEAKPQAEAVLKQVKAAPGTFEAVAKEKSDDYTKDQDGKFGPAARDANDISRFGEAYADAVFNLEVGAISDLIPTDEGWAIAKVTGKKTWPDDFKTAEPRTMAEAKTLAQGIYDQLQKGADFAALAKEKSEDEGSKANGGEYELTERGQWVKPFEKVAFSLKENEISKPFKTQFGYHILQVLQRELPPEGEEVAADVSVDDPWLTDEQKEETKAELAALELPQHADLKPAKRVKVRHILIKGEDPEQKLEDLREQFTEQKKREHFDEVMKNLREQAYDGGLIEVYDPEIKAYLASKDGDKNAEMFYLDLAARAWPNSHGEVHFELAKLYEQQGGFGSGAGGETKVAAAQALAKFPPEQVAPALIQALDTFEPDVRKAVINSLGELKAKEATGKLQEIVRSDGDDTVAQAAEEALKKIGAEVPKRARASGATLPSSGAVGITPPPGP